MKTFAPLVLLALFNVAAARYFPRSARQYDDYIRDNLMAEDYGMYRDPAPIKAASQKVCQTPCKMKQMTYGIIYTCETAKHKNDACSPKGYAFNGKPCTSPCELANPSFTKCYTGSAGSYELKLCSKY